MDWSTIASAATALGVLLAAWQIRESRRLSQVSFEDSLDRQYRDLAMQIPVDALLGKSIAMDERLRIREVIYNYLDLCNEQVLLRKRRRISRLRWGEWCEGIAANLRKPVFAEVWEEIKTDAPSEFTGLTWLEKGGFRNDPANWW